MPNGVNLIDIMSDQIITGEGVTLGEVFRKLLEQSSDLSEIKVDVKSQNGSLQDLKVRVAILEDRSRAAEAKAIEAKAAAATALERPTRDNAARIGGLSSFAASVGLLIWQWLTR
jgi:hypothetical protein